VLRGRARGWVEAGLAGEEPAGGFEGRGGEGAGVVEEAGGAVPEGREGMGWGGGGEGFGGEDAAAEDGGLGGAVLDERQMQPEFVFVGGDEVFDRGKGVAGEPVVDARREAVEVVLDGGGEGGLEPDGGEMQGDGFEAAELRGMEIAPCVPEACVRGAAVEEGGDFPGSLEAGVAAEDVE
jgi:hypothetical protein